MNFNLPRVPLANLPTPIDSLPRLSHALQGPRIFIKRDDLTGLACGGNKTRKLELFVAEAQARGADTLITLGGAQSNHCRQTAAAAARCGFRCILVLRGHAPSEFNGNLLLDHLLGARLVWSGDRAREEMTEEVVAAERRAGRVPYVIPVGGSTALGAAAYSGAMEELKAQSASLVEFDRIIFASSSGGTHAGLCVGAYLTGYRGQVLAISIDEELDSLQETAAKIATETARLLGQPRNFTPREIAANADYLGQGYGILGPAERAAIGLFARLEGVLLDPVYTARAAAGMIDLIRRGAIAKDETILFWHTGGIPALWAYAKELL
jgi:L-cysteate sulfo-lyase